MGRPSWFVLVLVGVITGTAPAGVFDPDVQGTGADLDDYMIAVPGGGEPDGPQYTYRVGKFEITNQQFCDFLNDAERDANSGAPTGRSSYMFFGPQGTVHLDSSMSVNEHHFRSNNQTPSSDIHYAPNAPLGQRYSIVTDALGNDKSKHPARNLSWIGAVKFCNWLTLDQGLGESEVCYTEGPDVGDWHPRTISTADWWGKTPAHNDRTTAGRGPNDAERSAWLREYRGFRLPMDGYDVGDPNDRPWTNPFDEWLKAASWDPAAPNTYRVNSGGWSASPLHWMFGMGREVNTDDDANWRLSGDPWENDYGTVPVDYYDGTDHGGTFPTHDTAHRYGFYGMSGNVWEWSSDYGTNANNRANYGGSWVSTPQRQAAASCYKNSLVNLADLSFGLRVMQVHGPVEFKLIGDDTATLDEFGRTVAIDGDYAVATAHFDDDDGNISGSAYVFQRTDTGWTQKDKLTASDAAPSDQFGKAVDITGDAIIIGARSSHTGSESGSAYIYERSGETWPEAAALDASDAADGDRFGQAVAISGDWAMVGAYSDDDFGNTSGSVYVFQRIVGTWTEVDKLNADDAALGDYFGWSVAMTSDRAVIGAYGNDDGASGSGSAYVFRRDNNTWVQEQKLLPADPSNTKAFGFAVGIHDDTIAVSGPWDDQLGSFAGAVYTYQRTGTTWIAKGKITADDGTASDLFGHDIGLADTRLVVGAFAHNEAGPTSGVAYVYDRNGTTWTFDRKLVASDLADEDQYGQGVAASGDAVLVGAPYGDDDGNNSGVGYLYELDDLLSGNTITVCSDGTGDYTSIAPAIAAAVAGDEVVICDGTYTGPDNKDLDFAGKAITVRSENGPEVTIIDLEDDGRAFNFHSGETGTSVLQGLAIINGDVSTVNEHGGAILCQNGSSPVITDCRFTGNRAFFGAAIACDASAPTISFCTFTENTASGSGGGISCGNGSDAFISDCDFRGNTAISGGGLRLYESNPIAQRCSLSGNKGNTAGGFYLVRSGATVIDCVVTGNLGIGVGGIYCRQGNPQVINSVVAGNVSTLSGGGIYFSENSSTITSCLITGNEAALTGGGTKVYLSTPTLINCTIGDNAAGSSGGGSHSEESSPTIVNTILWNNYPDEIVQAGPGTPDVTYSDIQGGYIGAGNIADDPLFVSGPTGNWSEDPTYDSAQHRVTFTDASAGWGLNEWVGELLNPDISQTLQLFIVANTATTITVLADRATVENGMSSISSGATYQIMNYRLTNTTGPPVLISPCINAGNNAALPDDSFDLNSDGNTLDTLPIDLIGNPRAPDCAVDLGAFERQDSASVNVIGDFDGDCDVDYPDILTFESCSSGPEIVQPDIDCDEADLDGDTDVDQIDFGLFQPCYNGTDRLVGLDCLE